MNNWHFQLWRLRRAWRLRQWQQRALDPVAAGYLAAQKAVDFRQPTAEAVFAVVDLETSGLDAAKDVVLSIGLTVVGRGCIPLSRMWGTLVQQTYNGPAETVKIHQILRSDLAEGLPEAEAARQLAQRLGGAVFVAHHAAFDAALVDRMFRQHLGVPLLNPVLDTHQLAIRLEHGPHRPAHLRGQDYTLDALCARYDVPIENRHQAPEDALATGILLLKFLKKAERKGIKTVQDVL